MNDDINPYADTGYPPPDHIPPTPRGEPREKPGGRKRKPNKGKGKRNSGAGFWDYMETRQEEKTKRKGHTMRKRTAVGTSRQDRKKEAKVARAKTRESRSVARNERIADVQTTRAEVMGSIATGKDLTSDEVTNITNKGGGGDSTMMYVGGAIGLGALVYALTRPDQAPAPAPQRAAA